MLVYAGASKRPLTQQTLTGNTGLLHRNCQQRQAQLSTEPNDIDILPDEPAVRATELI